MATTVGEIEIIIKAETDQLLKANKQVDRITDNMESGFKKADRSAEKLNTTVTKTAGAVSGGLRSGMQQAGYQIQDFIVQVQGGQSALVAFSQQGSQLAGAFGPGGAVVGAVIALGSVLVGSLSTALGSTKDEMEQLKNAAETLNKVVVINSQGVAALSNDYARLAVTNATLATQLRDNAVQQFEIAVRDAGKAITNVIDDQSSWWRSLNGGVASVKAFGGAMDTMEISSGNFNDAIKKATSLGPAFNSSTMTLINTVAMLSSQFDISDDAAFGLGKRLTDLAKNPSPQAVSSLVNYMSSLKPTTQDGADAIHNLRTRILDAAAAMQQAHDDGEALKNTLNELRTEAQQANFDGISKQLEAQRIALTKGKQAAIEYGIEQQNLTREQKDQLIAASRVNAQLEEEKDKRDKAAKASSRHQSSVDAAQQALAKQSNALSRLNTGYADGSLELAKYDAVVALGNKASGEQIAKAEQQAESIWKIQQATKAAAEEERKRTQAGQNFTGLQGQVSPVAAVDNIYAQQMAQLDEYVQLYPQKIAEAEAVRAGIEDQYHQKRMAAMWEEWQQQSEINSMLGAAVDSLQGGATNAITGLINGTQSLQESFANIGTTILNSVVGSFVQMGVEWVKSQLMGQAAAAASLASTMAQATAAASAWAPAAMSASIATYGSAAGVGQAAYAGSLLAAKGMAVAGARYNGGPVDAGSMYRVGEHGKPEIFQASNGSQYMIPGDNGRVISNRDMHGSGSGGSSVVQHITFEINTTGGIDDATKAWIVKSMKQVALYQINDQANRPNGMIQPRTKR
ncbi:phage tail protein [Salmonella enterica]|uniref:Phage tail protein n=1 Tax=Salmonella enterica subsp. enterica serovar Cerro TaxID=340188 RepID=A0A729FNK5_SALET|nr:phage tail protein [Salmonella enterica]EBL6658293.1 phage tail protein [Salmonella enterica subsp. enterica serovar Putten]EBW0794088.1 phage tail protein [Salmonella enterica subsp. enterica serovar Worthington]ECZ8891413.1 phage tail protein [Salmonella enterica subsp. enterica serovar Muenster]APT77072.1 Phage tail length tape-measure protein 1 [Salmonella enterica subsp. enterica serovar Cerro]EAQ6824552.1 phage tail protein [Salmonella enterica]